MTRVFLSCVSTEFRGYRELLTRQLSAAGVDVIVQEHFADSHRPILERLDEKVKASDCVVHLVGLGTGYRPKDGLPGQPSEVEQFLARRDRAEFLRTSGLEPHAADLPRLSYTQWEYWLARYYKKKYLVYHIEPTAEREKEFVKKAEEEAEQAAHLKRIRYTFDGRASVGGPWQLATRVLVSLTKSGTLDVSDDRSQPAVVVGFVYTTDGGYTSTGALRWKGRTFLLGEPQPLSLQAVMGGACDRLTHLLGMATTALADEQVRAKCVVELVLPLVLFSLPLKAWVHRLKRSPKPVPVSDWYPVRVRVAGQEVEDATAQNVRARLELLREYQEKLHQVCRHVPPEFCTSSTARPLAVLHQIGVRYWHRMAVVCGGFTTPPPAAKYRPAKPPSKPSNVPPKASTGPPKPSAKWLQSEHYLAMVAGVPFLVWPADPSADVSKLEKALTDMPRPAELCEYLEREPFVVFAECKDPPFPEGGKLKLDVNSHGASS